MPSHLGTSSQPKIKYIIPPNQASSDAEKQVTEIIENVANKRSLAWSLARLQALEKQLAK